MGIKRELLVGLPLIEKHTGKQLGTIQDLYLTDDKQAVEGLIISGSGWTKKKYLIPFEKIGSIGPHAIIVDFNKMKAIENNKNGNRAGDYLGMQVMTADGYTLGSISDLVIDPADGTIQSMELSVGLVDDLLKGRSTLPWVPPNNYEGDVHIITGEHANELLSYQKGIKIFFKQTIIKKGCGSMSKGRYMRGFVMGGLVGIAAGVLLLPQMDSSTRRKVLNRSANLVQNASHMIQRQK